MVLISGAGQVSATLAVAPLKLATMIELHWCTGMRSGELVSMKRSTIDQSTDPWLYRPETHKNEHRGQTRIIPLGPVAQNLITAWLPRVSSDWLFASSIPNQPMRSQSYRTAIARLNKKHNIPHWHPHQIRHAKGTQVANSDGLEAARDVLGHPQSLFS